MKKYIIFIIIFIFLLLFIKIPSYRELNHIIILDKLEVTCSKNSYDIVFYEVTPKRDGSGIKLNYKKYKESGRNLSLIKKKLEESSSKMFYYKSVDEVITNCLDTKEVIDVFSLKPKTIIHNKS